MLCGIKRSWRQVEAESVACLLVRVVQIHQACPLDPVDSDLTGLNTVVLGRARLCGVVPRYCREHAAVRHIRFTHRDWVEAVAEATRTTTHSLDCEDRCYH